MPNVTVRTFLKDGTEVTGKPVIIPPEVVIKLMKAIEPVGYPKKMSEKEGKELNLKSASVIPLVRKEALKKYSRRCNAD